MQKQNPFLIRGYISPEYFCDREEESKKIISSYHNNRNTTLYSLRRMGKTSLIEHIFHLIKKKGGNDLLYFDIYSTSNLSEFINLFGKTVFYNLSPKKNILNIISSTLKKVTPAIVFDRLTGEPSLQFSFRNRNEEEATLWEIFNYLNSRKKKILIAVDEFQQILNYPQKNVEALLRTFINKSPNLIFIYSGSEQHLLLSMFNNKNKPFYQSSEFMHLDKIDEGKYSEFIINKFYEGGMKISKDACKYILDWSLGFTFQTQFICNKLFELNNKNITIEHIQKVNDEILKMNDNIYLQFRNILSDFQWKTLKAIGKEGKVEMVTSKEFIKKHDLTTPSSVQTAVAALIKKGFISNENGKYFLNDVFFQRWFERH